MHPIVYADPPLPKEVIQFMQNHPDAKPQEIQNFVNNSSPKVIGNFKTKAELLQAIRGQYILGGSDLSNRLKRIIQNENLGIGFIFLALIISFVLGALHALTPGHGKTVVAAYLVGSQGRIIDAIILGIVTTITHTISVILIGLVTLFASEYILPQTLFPWVEFLSGVLIACIGIKLFMSHLQKRKATIPINSHEHTHNGVHYYSHTNTAYPSLGSIISLGISGGLVPCVDAMIVLLIAISLHKLVFGFIVLLAFSLGLASVLIGIGILLVLVSPYLKKFQGKSNWVTYRIPLFSSFLIALIGSFLAYKGFILTSFYVSFINLFK